MAFGFPSIKRYSLGIILVIATFLIFYLLIELWGIFTLNSMFALAAGLILGHLIGSIVLEKAETPQSTSTKEEIRTLYVGNLSFKTSRNELRQLFESYGHVHNTRIMVDKATRKPRGYGFVEMDSKDAKNAMNKLNGSIFAGRNIKVSVANEKQG